MNEIIFSSHIIIHIFFYPKLFLAILGYFTIKYFKLFYII
jgi:hypothetical protein